MKNLVFFSSLLVAAMFTFVSCGGNDPTDYTLKDLSVVAGNYTGQCVVSPVGTNNMDTTIATTVQLVGNSTVNTMQLQTDESGFATNHGDVLSNFKNTTDGLGYTFNIKGFTFTRNNIAYINKWFPSPTWSNISDVAVTINSSNDATYTKSNKTMTFSYTGTATFTATPQVGAASSQTVNVKYSFTVVKQ